MANHREFPNQLNKTGQESNLEDLVKRAAIGRQIMSEQKFEITHSFENGNNMVDESILSDKVTLNGDEIYFEVHGSGPPLVIIPAGESWFYQGLITELMTDFKVIVFDRRGNGRSTSNKVTSFSIRQQAS